MSRKTGRVWPWYLLSALLVGVDQLVKWLVRSNLRLGEQRPFIPLVELYYVRNTGAAFSLFEEHTWVLTIFSAVLSVALAWVLSRRRWVPTRWSRLAIALLLAGAVGNLVDRVAFGAVTDMFNFTFMTFGIFNVADICVTLGVILAFVRLFFGGKEEADGTHPADDSR